MASRNGLQLLQDYNSSSSAASSPFSNQDTLHSSSTPTSPLSNLDTHHSSSTPTSTLHTSSASSTQLSYGSDSSFTVNRQTDLRRAYVSNVVEFLRIDPTYGTHVLPEDLRDTYYSYVAKRPNPYTFDEFNEILLYNFGHEDS